MPVTLQPTTLKYKDGQTFVSADCLKGDPGSPGDPTQLIDDTAGSGDTGKTWSADKLATLSATVDSKAGKANPEFTGSISLGRVENSTVGEKSTATGTLVTASGANSQAKGYGTTASGSCSSAEGNQTFAVGDYSHSQGYGAMANGEASSAEGNGTVANGANSSVSGMYNVPDSYANWPDWAPNTYYAAGAKVHFQDEQAGDPRGEYFVCNTPHTSGSAWITYSFYWDSDNGKMNYAQIVGNGSNYLQQSNAYTLDWRGNGAYAGDVTINKGTQDEVSVSELKTEIAKSELVNFIAHDHLTVSGVRIKTDGKPTDMSSYNASPFIPVKAGYTIKFGMYCSDISAAFAYYTTNEGNPEASYVVAGTGVSAITSGEYTVLADGYIRFCSRNSYTGEYLYFTNFESDASKKLLHDLQLNGTSIVQNGSANIPYAGANDPGVVKVGAGLYIGSSGKLQTAMAQTTNIKAGTDNNHPIVPSKQHEAVFYGLAKLAGADMSSSSNPVGTFTDTALKKIQELIGTRLLKGKKILVFGDSIWGNDRTDGIADFLAEYSSATVYNGAVGGTRITDLRHSQYDAPDYLYFDGVKLIHAFLTNTWTEQEAHKESVLSYVKNETLPMLEALDASTIDMIILAYGYNDIAHGETLVQIQTAFETVIDDILTHFPSIRIVMIAPPWRMFSNGEVDGDVYESSSGLTMRGLCNGMIETAMKKHITILDTFAELPICANTADTYMDNDHVHLNATGNALYAHVVHGKLRSMF